MLPLLKISGRVDAAGAHQRLVKLALDTCFDDGKTDKSQHELHPVGYNACAEKNSKEHLQSKSSEEQHVQDSGAANGLSRSELLDEWTWAQGWEILNSLAAESNQDVYGVEQLALVGIGADM